MFHFQLRGRENRRDMKQNTFKFYVYDDSRECVFIKARQHACGNFLEADL